MRAWNSRILSSAVVITALAPSALAQGAGAIPTDPDAASQALRARLDKQRTDLNFRGTDLRDVLSFLKDMLQVPVKAEPAAVAGKSLTLSLRGERLSAAALKIGEQTKVSVRVKGGALVFGDASRAVDLGALPAARPRAPGQRLTALGQRLLGSEKAEDRRAAAEAIGAKLEAVGRKTGPSPSGYNGQSYDVQALARALNDPNEEVLLAVLEAIGRDPYGWLGNQGGRLVALAAEGPTRVRVKALETLRFAPPFTEWRGMALKACDDEDVKVRRAAARTLSYKGRWYPKGREYAREHKDLMVRRWATLTELSSQVDEAFCVEVLGIKAPSDEESLEAEQLGLWKRIHQSRPWLKDLALELLEESRSRSRYQRDGELEGRMGLIIAKLGAKAEETAMIREMLTHPSRPGRPVYRVDRILAVGCLGPQGAASIPDLAGFARSSKEREARAAVWALGRMGAAGKPGLEALIGALEHPEWRVRREAIRALESWADHKWAKTAAAKLSLRSREESKAEVRRSALIALGAFGSAATPELIRRHRVGGEDRFDLVKALGAAARKDKKALKYLASLMLTADAGMASYELEKAGRKSLPLLKKVFRRADRNQKAQIAELVKAIKKRRKR